MTQLDQYVNTGADDWTEGDPASDSGNTLVVRYLGSSSTVSTGYALIDTSSIPSDATITSATFYWYDHSHVNPRGAGVDSSIKIWDNVSAYVEIFNFTSFSSGAKSHDLESGELQYINTAGDTKFQFTTQQNGSKDRTWDVRAYDGYSGSSEQPRLVVDYTEAGGERVSIIMV